MCQTHRLCALYLFVVALVASDAHVCGCWRAGLQIYQCNYSYFFGICHVYVQKARQHYIHFWEVPYIVYIQFDIYHVTPQCLPSICNAYRVCVIMRFALAEEETSIRCDTSSQRLQAVLLRNPENFHSHLSRWEAFPRFLPSIAIIPTLSNLRKSIHHDGFDESSLHYPGSSSRTPITRTGPWMTI